jgi:hypothetical protein
MMDRRPDHGLEFLLAFHGRIHFLERGYWLKFEIQEVEATKERPHGLSYSFTMHAPDGSRLVGFDNAHQVRPKGARFKGKRVTGDHWHRTKQDRGRPYSFKDTITLLEDFFSEVERVARDRGIGTEVVTVEESPRRK